MESKLDKLLSNRKIVTLVYFLIILLATPISLYWLVKVTFWIFATYIFWLVKDNLSNKKTSISDWWLLLPFSILIGTRLLPFFRWPVMPLGADYATYEKSFLICSQNQSWCPGNILTLVNHLFYSAGWSINYLVPLLYIFLNVFVALALYIVVKEEFNKEAAFFSLIIFSISSSQFLFYWSFYWKMMLALSFALIALYLLRKKSWLVIPIVALIAPIHPAVYAVFVLIILLYWFFNKKKRFVLWSILAIVFLSLAIYGKELLDLINLFFKNSLTIFYSNQPSADLSGHFINFKLYRSLILIYLPFIVLGFIESIRKKKSLSILLLIVTFLLVISHFYFYNRFIILFDIAAIMIAGPILARFFNQLRPSLTGKTLLIVLLITSTYFAFYQSWLAEPLITTREELVEIKSLNELKEVLVITDLRYYPIINRYYRGNFLEAYDPESLIKILKNEEDVYIYIGQRTSTLQDVIIKKNLKPINKHIWHYQK